ncbi:DUF2628 domain-containing protein [Bauldia sp.]|uniref:DUF2628 domain-containing protein n=1 Tax=Bauldia sp. TaxID=2575872 RepID=UPI003BA9A846
MAFYTVLVPPDTSETATDSLIFVKEGFCWPALFVPLIWSIYCRQWLILLFLLAAVLVLVAIGGTVATVVYWLGRVWFALEANGLRRWTLERNGHRTIAVVEGRTQDEAERRYFEEIELHVEPADPTADDPPAPSGWEPVTKTPPEERPVVGLFPSPNPTR